MDSITVSAKIPAIIAKQILDTGFSTSDIVQVGVQWFLLQSKEEQQALIEKHLRHKKRKRALERYKNIGQDQT